MDYERKQDQLRKQSKDFKKKREQLRNVRSRRDNRLESRKGALYESGSTLSLDSEVMMLLAFKKLQSINLNNKYSSFALGKPEDTRHLTLVLNTTLSFMTRKQIVVAKRLSSSNYLFLFSRHWRFVYEICLAST